MRPVTDGQRGTSTLEVIAALILFSLAAAGLAVVLPMAYGRAKLWSDQQTLAWFLERNLEEWRGTPYEAIPFGNGTLTSENLGGKQLTGSYTTTMASESSFSGNATWSYIASPPNDPEHGLTAEYYSNADFTGSPLTRIDSQVNFDWGSGSPDGTIPADGFTVRWSGFLEAQYSETYTFFTTTTVGVRLWINDTLLINNWTDHTSLENSAGVGLKAGKKYKIRLEITETSGTAAIALRWQSPSTSKQIIPASQLYNNLPKKTDLTVKSSTSDWLVTGKLLVFPTYIPEPLSTYFDQLQGLAGLYFDSLGNAYNDDSEVFNVRFNGSNYSRIDPTINFQWEEGVPAPSIAAESFGVRWTGFVIPPTTGNYTFYTNTDDGVRLWVNNILLIDRWDRHSATEHAGNSVFLQGGQRYPITLDFFEWTGNANAQLYWSGPSIAKQIIPQSQLFPAYSPSEDTYISQNNSSMNYGNNPRLYLRGNNNNVQQSYLKFNISGIAGKTIKSATLRLRVTEGVTPQFEVWQTNTSWGEDSLDWNPRPSMISASALGSWSQATAAGSFIDIPLNPDFLANGDGVYSLAIIPTGGNNQAAFYSRELSPNTDSSTTYRPDMGPRLILDIGSATNPNNINILYQCVNSNTSTNTIAPWFQVVNNGSAPIALSRITIRYWMTDEYWLLPPVLECDWAQVGDSNITASFVQQSGDYDYMEIGFTSRAGTLAAGSNSGQIQTRIHHYLWLNYNQSNDYSFDPTFSTFGQNLKITAYVDGVLVFGTEP